jgi:hypothetical protein
MFQAKPSSPVRTRRRFDAGLEFRTIQSSITYRTIPVMKPSKFTSDAAVVVFMTCLVCARILAVSLMDGNPEANERSIS